MRSRNAALCRSSQVVSTAEDRPGTRSSKRAVPVPSNTGVRSTITVTYPSPAARQVCAQRCSSTPITRTESSRAVSAASSPVVASTAIALTVSHDRPSSRAIAAIEVRSIINRRRTCRAQRRVVDQPGRARRSVLCRNTSRSHEAETHR